jgi:Tfp pilus assembly protein PilF
VLAFEPHRARSLNNLGFILAGEKRWTEAEDLFKQALEYQIETPAITLTNLGYIYLHQQKYIRAVQTLETAQQQAIIGEKAILRIACWYNNQLLDTPDELFPKRFTSTLLAVRANLATAYYLNNQLDQALAMAQTTIDTDPQDNIGCRLLGCLYLASGEVEAARKAWEKALQLRRSKAETKLIQSWLADLSSPQN